jgi:hypothetical protein
MGQLEFNYIWIYDWIVNNFSCQYDIHYITKLYKHGGWRTWNTNIQSCGCGCCFCCCHFLLLPPTSPHPLLLVHKWFVYLNISKRQMVLSGSLSEANPTIDQYVVPWGSMSKYHKDTCLWTIGPDLQTTLHSTLNTMGRRPYVSW